MNARLEKILDFARQDKSITFVIQNGSRVNPSVVPDKYADYDIVYGCKDFAAFLSDRSWISFFGELIIVQQNSIVEGLHSWPIFLMQFKDGLRIDLQFFPGKADYIYANDSLSKILLDKSGLLPKDILPTECSYLAHRPTEGEYRSVVNEFWWCVLNVGKGLARGELTYSMYMFEAIVRESFLALLGWYASSLNDWRVNPGKFGKFLPRYLDPDLWKAIESTYSTSTKEDFWKSIYKSCEIVSFIDNHIRTEIMLAAKTEQEEEIIRFLKRIENNEIEELI